MALRRKRERERERKGEKEQDKKKENDFEHCLFSFVVFLILPYFLCIYTILVVTVDDDDDDDRVNSIFLCQTSETKEEDQQ